MVDASALQMVLAVLTGWLDRQERHAVVYLMEENRILRRQLRGQRLQFTDSDRRRLAVRGHRLGLQVLRQIASVVTPDTILRWHRQIIVRKWTYAHKRSGRHGVLTEIRRLWCGWRKRIPPGATREFNGLVKPAKSLEYYSERSAMRASTTTGYSLERDFEYGVKEDGKIALQVKFIQRIE